MHGQNEISLKLLVVRLVFSRYIVIMFCSKHAYLPFMHLYFTHFPSLAMFLYLLSFPQPIKPLNSTSTCVYKLNGKAIASAECTESHIFRPFSAGYDKPAGAITTVKQSLKLIGEKYRGKSAVTAEKREKVTGVSLAYVHEAEAMKPDNEIVKRIDNVMSSLVDISKKDNYAAKQSSAHEFTHLVNLVRKLDRKRMAPVMDKYFDCYKSGLCASSDSDVKSVYR